MSLSDLTEADAVRRAIAEFDTLGRGAFLAKYGYRPARSYFLVYEGRRYDSKAIVGVALALQHPGTRLLRGKDFTGGDATVRRKLEQLGFQVEVDVEEVSASGAAAPLRESQAKLADHIRAYTFDHVVRPQLSQQDTARVRVGDLHRSMNFQNRIPAVTGALKARQFADEYGLVLVGSHGQPVSPATTLVFAFAEDEVAAGRSPNLSDAHIRALDWFRSHAGQTESWATLHDFDPPLASAPKAIYRPKGWRHAISVKVIPGSRYPDELPSQVQPGAVFRYHEEQPRGADPNKHFTNLGLANAMRDRVPVGVIRQVKPKPHPLYEVVGIATVLEWRDGFFTLQVGAPTAPSDIVHDKLAEPIPPEASVPLSHEDARRKVSRAIFARRGQAKFRKTLLEAYGWRCAISGCDVVEVLEAAHIQRYLGDHTNIVPNGLLLRADLHTLFDLGVMKIDPTSRRVILPEHLRSSPYPGIHGVKLRPPANAADRPSVEHLQFAWTQGELTVEGDEVN